MSSILRWSLRLSSPLVNTPWVMIGAVKAVDFSIRHSFMFCGAVPLRKEEYLREPLKSGVLTSKAQNMKTVESMEISLLWMLGWRRLHSKDCGQSLGLSVDPGWLSRGSKEFYPVMTRNWILPTVIISLWVNFPPRTSRQIVILTHTLIPLRSYPEQSSQPHLLCWNSDHTTVKNAWCFRTLSWWHFCFYTVME